MDYERTETPLYDRHQTAQEIKRLINDYYTDLDIIMAPVSGGRVPLSSLPFDMYFDYIRKLPYKRDKAPIEQVGRPAWIIEKRANGRDCKKAATMIGAYLKYHRIPFRLIGSSTRKDRAIHHIFPQMRHGSTWINVDATYSDYYIGQPKKLTAKEIL